MIPDDLKPAGKPNVFACPAVLGLLLAAATLAAYWPVMRCDFVSYDDPGYFSANDHVLAGLSMANLRWAFTTVSAANWHPLTWISLMLDATMFGKGPSSPHFINLLFHLANTVLVFLLLRRLTSATWRSAFVAALFALHPLHVESVAWVAERKDVLSAFFGLLSLLAYARYVEQSKVRLVAPKPGEGGRQRSEVFYGLTLLFFALGLMSKAMLVTWPFVMLLLDAWPLQRFKVQGSGFKVQNLIWEKIPFLVLSAASSVVTFTVQHQAGVVATLAKYSALARTENAVVSYARYLGKTFWPFNLANPYPHPGFWPGNPHPGFWPAGLVWFSVLLFAGLSIAAIWCWRKFPFVTVGWFWYVGTLIPVIGLVQVGAQAMADRYTYLPLIGIFIVLSWGGAEIQARWRLSRRRAAWLAAVALAACAMRTRNQAGLWQNDGTLFFHALTKTRNNYVACVNLGTWFSKNGQIEETFDCYYQALRMNPSDPSVLYDVGNAFAKIGYWADAVNAYHHALQIAPNESDILNNLGFALAAQKQFANAITCFEAALKLKPDYADAHNNLATVLFIQKNYDVAVRHFREALRLTHGNPQIYGNLGDALVKQGQTNEAAQCYQEALRLEPGDAQLKAKLQALGAPVSN
jgi:protein O-mannosyl-transferase